jgi:hypothetical protein
MAVESRRFWKRMLTALPYRFYFEAVCLAGFRVPQESRPVKAPIHFKSFSRNDQVRCHDLARLNVKKLRTDVPISKH